MGLIIWKEKTIGSCVRYGKGADEDYADVVYDYWCVFLISGILKVFKIKKHD